MTDDDAWRKMKPFAIAAGAIAVLAGTAWWYFNMSSFVALKDGRYSCVEVFVGEDGKYTILTDDSGNEITARAKVMDNQVVALKGGGQELTPDGLENVFVKRRGNEHFHVTGEQVVSQYNAMACDFVR
jgi:hypothetical protein